MKRIVVAALSLVVLFGAAACGEDTTDGQSTATPKASPEAIPWSDVVELADAKEGEYEKVITAPQGGSVETVFTEWVTFDLQDRFIDRAVGMGAGLGGGVEATKEQPSLRFLYMEDGFLMWNPGAEQACGTPWVDMPPEAVEAVTGLSIQADDLFVVEPFDVIAAAEPPEEAKSVTEDARVYEITVPGMTGIPTSSGLASKPRLIRELQQQELSAEVTLPSDGSSWEMVVDLTPAFEVIEPGLAAGGDAATTTWMITAPKEVPDPELPSDVADFSCMK